MIHRLSLRARLILGVIALAGVGLAAAGAITYASLRSFLISQTDDFLDTAHVSAESGLHGAGRRRRAGRTGTTPARAPTTSRTSAR